MTINATLERLAISSPQVDRVAQFYVNTFGYRAEKRGEPDRPVGNWTHCMETLNRWGVVIMRS